MSTLITLTLAFVLAFFVESFTEYIFGALFDKAPKLTPYRWTLQYLAMAAGIGLAFYYQIDLIAYIVNSVAPDALVASWVGFLLTGMGLGRGSEWLHRFVSKFLPKTAARYGGA